MVVFQRLKIEDITLFAVLLQVPDDPHMVDGLFNTMTKGPGLIMTLTIIMANLASMMTSL